MPISFVIKQTSIVFILCLMLSGCASGEHTFQPLTLTDSPQEQAFAEVFPVANLTNDLRVSFLKEFYDEITETSAVNLGVENLSDVSLWFPIDYGARIFVYSEKEGQWVELKNETLYTPLSTNATSFVLDPNPGIYAQSFSISFSIENLEQPLPVRITVMGKVISNEQPTDQEVGSLVDFIVEH